ncbi:MAG: hypothetical protein IT166_11065 [Bryobacterales bacterium]|nr:hypothetical protein [Bryobacterales bacterium]
MPGPVAPGEFVTIFGEDLGPLDLVRREIGDGRTSLETSLADTRVLFDGAAKLHPAFSPPTAPGEARRGRSMRTPPMDPARPL